MKKLFTALFTILLGLFSNQIFAQKSEIVETEHGLIMKDVNYLQYFAGEQLMDVYLSYDATPRQPFVILVHGGAFTHGDKKDMNELAMELLKHNISSVSINYSLLSKKFFKEGSFNTYQTMIHNIWNAIQHVQMKSDEWSVRKTDFILLGEEAGAYLSLLAGYNFYSEIESIIAISPITDLRDIASFNRLAERKGQEKILFTKLIGGEEYKSNKYLTQTYLNASPIDQARAVPTILIHGVKDQKIPYVQSAKLYNMLKDNGVQTKIYTLENGGADLIYDMNHKQSIFNYIIHWINNKN